MQYNQWAVLSTVCPPDCMLSQQPGGRSTIETWVKCEAARPFNHAHTLSTPHIPPMAHNRGRSSANYPLIRLWLEGRWRRIGPSLRIDLMVLKSSSGKDMFFSILTSASNQQVALIMSYKRFLIQLGRNYDQTKQTFNRT